jgi:hypothetical protein
MQVFTSGDVREKRVSCITSLKYGQPNLLVVPQGLSLFSIVRQS